MSVLVQGTATKSATQVDSTTWTHTTVAKTNSMLVVVLSARTSGDILPSDGFAVTFNSVSMTKLRFDTGYRCWSAIYYLVNPAVGAYTVSASPEVAGGGNNRNLMGVSYQLYNVKGIQDSTGTTGTATSSSLSRTATKAGSLMIDVSRHGGSTVGTLGASQTAVFNTTITGGGSTSVHHSSYKTVVAGSQSMSYSGRDSDVFVHSVALIEPEPTGGAFLLNMI
jgi:hypothetical protein